MWDKRASWKRLEWAGVLIIDSDRGRFNTQLRPYCAGLNGREESSGR